MLEEDKDCIIKSERFVVLSLILEYKELLHQNMLIYDKKLKTLERFEPHGSDSPSIFETKKLDNNIKTITQIPYLSELQIEQYFTPEHFCPKIGLQNLEEENKLNEKLNVISGTCQVWAIVYTYYRLKNPDIERDKLIKNMISEITKKSNPYTFIYGVIQIMDDIIKKINTKVISENEKAEVYIYAPDIDKF